MSHELRTPLNSIIGFARVILKGIDGPITELQQQDLTAIFNSGQHLLGLINDILDLSRIEAGKMELTFDEVNISDLISSVMSTAVGLVKDKPIQLRSALAEDLPLVRADAMRIRQVLINFLSNAAKFTEEGEILVTAHVEKTEKGQDAVRVSVVDTGPGISEEDQAKLFQPFSQVDASLTRRVGGSGLGLSICHHLIQMHNGQIGIQSAPGKGSTFYFSIPVVKKTKIGGQEDERVILAIDDDPQIISLYERYLQPKGFHVIGLSDPAKARERVEQLKPFAITLDIMMPGYDGWQVLTDLKSSQETREVPVIVCSIVEDEEKGFSLGAADYLVKPVLEEDLLASLDRLNGDGSIREVLIIDDDPNDLRLLGKMLTEQGKYRAMLAEGGPAGWNAIRSKLPHAVVLDLFMPEMDGFTILEQLRQDEKLRNLPVIVITGADLSGEQRKQLDDLGQRLLQKSSLREKELISTIENALHRVKIN
jgi:CheY-like chemotaxis protein/two-component sensor histidine kinase